MERTAAALHLHVACPGGEARDQVVRVAVPIPAYRLPDQPTRPGGMPTLVRPLHSPEGAVHSQVSAASEPATKDGAQGTPPPLAE